MANIHNFLNFAKAKFVTPYLFRSNIILVNAQCRMIAKNGVSRMNEDGMGLSNREYSD